MAIAVYERMQRFDDNLKSLSHASDDVAALLGTSATSVHGMVAYIRAIYPPLEDGQTVLGTLVDPVEADRAVSSCPAFDVLANEVDSRRQSGSPRWSSTAGELNRSFFNPVSPGGNAWSGKPDGTGLFTSDATLSAPSMWDAYMASWLGV